MMFYCLSDEQENKSGNAKPQDRQEGNKQDAFHGESPFLIVPVFTNSLSLSKRKNNSAGILSFLWESHPTCASLTLQNTVYTPCHKKGIG
jgi:hypothetical protein